MPRVATTEATVSARLNAVRAVRPGRAKLARAPSTAGTGSPSRSARRPSRERPAEPDSPPCSARRLSAGRREGWESPC